MYNLAKKLIDSPFSRYETTYTFENQSRRMTPDFIVSREETSILHKRTIDVRVHITDFGVLHFQTYSLDWKIH